MPKHFRVFVLAMLLLLVPWNSRAQTTTEAILSAPETSSFPQVNAYLSVRDFEGRFVSGLTASDIVLLENGQEIPADTLEEQAPGAQITLAINPGPSFAVRDTIGASRFERVITTLTDWANAHGGSLEDELSVMLTGNAQPIDVDVTADKSLASVLADLPDDYSDAVANLNTLSVAINKAGDPIDRAGMGRAVLFITPHPDDETIQSLGDMVNRAILSEVRVYVWMVTSDAFFNTSGAEALQSLAESTGGKYFAFSGTETLPDPETYFDASRRIYALSYSSGIRSSGQFELSAEIRATGFEAVSPPTEFDLNVQPPNPIFVSPPAEISRNLVPDSEGNLSAASRTPLEQSIEILIEFPDGYLRKLVRTTLYVNGEVAAENTEAPFDTFTWNLADITESDRYTLQVEAVDELGLSSISLETPVSISVEQLPDGFVPAISNNSSLIVTVAVLVVGVLLILLLLRARKLRPAAQNGKGKKKRRPTVEEPVLQPREAPTAPVPAARLSRWANRLHWPQRSAVQDQPIAYLDRLYEPNSLEALTPGPPHPIYTTEITLGNDPNQATFVLEEPSVAPLHARLQQNEGLEFYISDLNSVAGTYINFLPTNGSPSRIEHGDLLHFGKVGFRFRLNPAPQVSPPSIEILGTTS